MSEYAKRNIELLGELYLNHVSAMTGESLHSKSDIAAELAYRDYMYAQSQLDLEQANKSIQVLAEALSEAADDFDEFNNEGFIVFEGGAKRYKELANKYKDK